LAQTFFLRFLVEAITNKSIYDGYYWAGALTLSMIVLWLLHHQYFFRSEVVGNNLKTCILALVYMKVWS